MSEHYEHDKETTSNIINDIKEHQLHISYVQSDGYSPRFGYSIGLFKEFNHPELLLIGLDDTSTGAIINSIKDEIENGTRFIEGINYPGFLVNFPIQFLAVEKEHYQDYLGYAGWYNDQSFDFPALQVIWPDKNGNFPWEDDFNERFKFVQPLLDRNTDFKFLEEKNLGVYTTKEFLEGKPILYVYHDEDGDWQFLTKANPTEEEISIVALSTIIKKDASLNDIYYLNYGESASRESINGKWTVFDVEEED